jgi:hypothetical protein
VIDLDRASLDRVRPPTPGSADWDDVMSRAGTHQGRRRRRLVVLAAVLLMAVGTASAFGVRALILDKGFVGLPPEGATPSTPESGELVLSYFGPEPTGRGSGVWLYTDGRLIWRSERSTGFLEQRLTPEGVELLRSEVVSTLLGHDQQSPDTEPIPEFALHPGINAGFSVRVRDGDRLVGIGDPWPNHDGTASPAELQVSAPRVTASDFSRLVERLTDPVSWLPASAWVERAVRAYVPTRYAVCYGGRPRAIEPSRILAWLPAPVEELLRVRPSYRSAPDFVPRSQAFACSDATTQEARELEKDLKDAGFERAGGGVNGEESLARLVYRFEPPGPRVTFPDPAAPYERQITNMVYIWFEPELPHGEITCSICG